MGVHSIRMPAPAPAELPPVAAMPKEIAQSVVLVMRAVGMLAKATKNEQGRYNYASIDAFLAAVNPACAEAGLIIQPIELSVEPTEMEVTDKDGRPKLRRQLRFRYQFLLIHADSGVSWLNERDVRNVTVEATGAQAYGAAQSYAMKQFMRALFQIPTGDTDADADEQHQADLIRATVKSVKAKRDGGGDQVLLSFGGDLTPVAVADVDGKVLAHIAHLADRDAIAAWQEDNTHGLKEYWAVAPRLAIALKRKIEAATKGLANGSGHAAPEGAP